MRRSKVLVVGPVGAGKTTAIQSLTEGNSVLTEALVSDSARLRKNTTTVAMDLGVVRLAEDHVVHVYGAPGQERFDFMWEVLSVGVEGVILLLDNHRNHPREDLQNYLAAFAELITATRLIIGVSRSDIQADPPLTSYARWLGEFGINADVAFIDPRCKSDVEFLLRQLLDQPLAHTSQPIPSLMESGLADAAVRQAGGGDPAPRDIDFDQAAFQAISVIIGVTGATLTNGSGVILSTIEDQALNDYVAFLHGLAPSLGSAASMERVQRISFKSEKDENLTVFFGSHSTLGVRTARGQSIPQVVDQVKELMQWIKL